MEQDTKVFLITTAYLFNQKETKKQNNKYQKRQQEKMNPKADQELNTFINGWDETSNVAKNCFIHFKNYLREKEDVRLDFIARPGITYSLRAVHKNQKDKELFVMVDVIEDTTRWLSICFYSDMITDPQVKGDFVPGGLLGEDALCFDLDEQSEEFLSYLEKRIDECLAQFTTL